MDAVSGSVAVDRSEHADGSPSRKPVVPSRISVSTVIVGGQVLDQFQRVGVGHIRVLHALQDMNRGVHSMRSSNLVLRVVVDQQGGRYTVRSGCSPLEVAALGKRGTLDIRELRLDQLDVKLRQRSAPARRCVRRRRACAIFRSARARSSRPWRSRQGSVRPRLARRRRGFPASGKCCCSKSCRRRCRGRNTSEGKRRRSRPRVSFDGSGAAHVGTSSRRARPASEVAAVGSSVIATARFGAVSDIEMGRFGVFRRLRHGFFPMQGAAADFLSETDFSIA